MLTDRQILILGDQARDLYHWCKIRDFNPEGPVPILDLVNCDERSGMAANVARNLEAFAPSRLDCVFGSMVSVKNRYMDERSRRCLMRVDSDALSDPVTLPACLEQYDAVVVSDYNKGSITLDLVKRIRNIYTGPIFVDTKIRDLAELSGCMIKINQREWDNRISDHQDVVVTKGAQGATYQNKHYPALITDAHDVCGAGDTFLAALVAGFLCWQDMDRAINLALAASALAVRHVGTYSLNPSDVESLCGY